jgi:hypothetical protein
MKNPTASTGFEPANLGTRGQHATSRPPKPLDASDTSTAIEKSPRHPIHSSIYINSFGRWPKEEFGWSVFNSTSDWSLLSPQALPFWAGYDEELSIRDCFCILPHESSCHKVKVKRRLLGLSSTLQPCIRLIVHLAPSSSLIYLQRRHVTHRHERPQPAKEGTI